MVFVVTLLVGIAGAGALAWLALRPLEMNPARVELTVTTGSSARGVAALIQSSGVGLHPWVFLALVKVTRSDSLLKAGSYELQSGMTPMEVLSKLSRGDVTQGELSLVEGTTFRQLRQKLESHPDLRHEMNGLSESEILRRLGIPAPGVEGLFYPDTYLFDKRSSDLDLLQRAHKALLRRMDAQWEKRAPGLPYANPYEALVMASIIEKETGRAEDRYLIAAVFVNRLKKGMMLQTDPTVIYGLGTQFDGNLRRSDLTHDTPYNTYTRKGLPPTPIAMVSEAALHAALHPAASDALYFVARGDGSSQFSRTLEEHNRAVNKYQRKVAHE